MTTSSAKSKAFFTLSLLVVSDDKIWFKYLAKKYVGVFIVDEIGRNFAALLTTVLSTLGLPQKIPGVTPTGHILWNYFSKTFFSFVNSVKPPNSGHPK